MPTRPHKSELPTTQPTNGYTPVPFTDVTIADHFWAPRQRINRERTLPHIDKQNTMTGRIDAFRRDWAPAPELTWRDHRWRGSHVMFWDSDVAKWIEAAAYSLAIHPDPTLDARLDAIITLIAERQEPDGYMNTWFLTVDPVMRWANLRDWHELYNAGHMIEAAVAHYEATGKRTLLEVMCRYADHIGEMFGRGQGQKRGYCGHPEIELALLRLARATGEPRYYQLARYFVDERGQQPHYFDQEAIARGQHPSEFWARSYEYNQSHLPVREQVEAVGHAVRAMYLYSAMAELAGAENDQQLHDACTRLWHHLTTKRMYVMGGIGTSAKNEGFTSDYDLPNESAYAETCAAIGLVFWAQRMLKFSLDRHYTDILELALYNAVLSGVSHDGEHFFYENPLASTGDHQRQEWFSCPCCPPNLARIIASVGGYVYAQNEREAIVHLYVQGSGLFHFGEQTVTLHQATDYPWDGRITLRVATDQPTPYTLRLRIPGWCSAPAAWLNGTPINALAENGYLGIERKWCNGDEVVLMLPMPAERIYARPEVTSDLGLVALRRGPLIYCVEQVDQSVPVERIVLPTSAALTAEFCGDLLDGVVAITGPAFTFTSAGWADDELYRTTPPALQPCTITAIPYYAWGNRTPGAMRVWLPTMNA